MTVCFWSVAEHHALAIRPIYNKMKKMGEDAVSLFNQPANKLLPHSKIVSGTAPDIPPSKRKNTIYHFHSIHPVHIKRSEPDYKYMPLFKGLMLPGKWWIDKWKKLPQHWRVVGWPKADSILRQPPRKRGRNVLYASGMHNFDQHKTLKMLMNLAKKIGFKLLVKPHGGRKKWYPDLIKTMRHMIRKNPSIRWFNPLGDIVNLFKHADVLVGESSGSLWEFMATGRPSIQVDVNAHRWDRLFPGGVVKANFNTLPQVLKSCLDNPQTYDFLEWRNKVMGKLDGKATDRAIAFIEEVFK